MSPRTYFRASLALPILLPVLAMPFFDASALTAILWLSLGFGGAAYLVFGIVIFWWLGKIQTVYGIKKLTCWAPVIFIPVQAIFWLGSYYIERLSNPELVGGWESIPAFAVYILLIGYSYVLVVNVGYYFLNKLGAFNEQSFAP